MFKQLNRSPNVDFRSILNMLNRSISNRNESQTLIKSQRESAHAKWPKQRTKLSTPK